jgi:DNA-binding beta-propeller fold protein YncE
MKNTLIRMLVIALTVGFATAAWAGESVVVKPNAAKRFAKLPADLVFPEGITANPVTRDIFVGTFDTNEMPTNALLRYSKSGKLEARRNLTPPMLDLAYNNIDGMVYFINFGESTIQRIDADFDGGTQPETVATIPMMTGPPPPRIVGNPDGTTDIISFGNVFPAPNALVFNSAGHLYVSDSFQGAIFVIEFADSCMTPCMVSRPQHRGA